MSILSLLMSVVMALSLSIGAPDQGMGSYQLEITSGIEAEGLWDAFSMQDLIMPENQAAPSAVLRDVQKLLDAVKLRAQTEKNALKLELLSMDGAALADVSIFLEEGTYTLVTSLLPGMALTYSEDFAVAHTPEELNTPLIRAQTDENAVSDLYDEIQIAVQHLDGQLIQPLLASAGPAEDGAFSVDGHTFTSRRRLDLTLGEFASRFNACVMELGERPFFTSLGRLGTTLVEVDSQEISEILDGYGTGLQDEFFDFEALLYTDEDGGYWLSVDMRESFTGREEDSDLSASLGDEEWDTLEVYRYTGEDGMNWNVNPEASMQLEEALSQLKEALSEESGVIFSGEIEIPEYNWHLGTGLADGAFGFGLSCEDGSFALSGKTAANGSTLLDFYANGFTLNSSMDGAGTRDIQLCYAGPSSTRLTVVDGQFKLEETEGLRAELLINASLPDRKGNARASLSRGSGEPFLRISFDVQPCGGVGRPDTDGLNSVPLEAMLNDQSNLLRFGFDFALSGGLQQARYRILGLLPEGEGEALRDVLNSAAAG